MTICGIAGVYLKYPERMKRHSQIERLVDELLLGIEHRGKEATGIASFLPGGKGTFVQKEALTAREFIKDRDTLPEQPRIILLHTRLATKGDPKISANNHPVMYNTCFTVHNGMIWNDDELFEEAHLQRYAEVDSEIIPALLQRAGFNEPQKAYEQLRGPFATASADPMQYPDELLLAKAGNPLFWHESEKFIVWASTKLTLETAWKKVLGTPPKGIQEMADGKFLHVMQEGGVTVLEPGEFKRDFTARTTSGTGKTTTNFTGRGNNTQRRELERTAESLRQRALADEALVVPFSPEHRTLVHRLRMDGKGHSRVYNLRETYNWDEFKDVPGGRFNRGNDLGAKWVDCPGCHESVLQQDMRHTLIRGAVCLDCIYVTTAQRDGVVLTPLDPDKAATLDSWTATEGLVHQLTLKTVSRATGYSMESIDWLIFRMPPQFGVQQKDLADLAGELDDLYQEAYQEEWNGLGAEEGKSEGPEISNVVQVGRCETCKAFMRIGTPCVKCAKKPRVPDPKETTLHCMDCYNRVATVFIADEHGVKYAYCGGCYFHCNNRGCKEKANHLHPTTKIRYCHIHARGNGELLADGLLKSRGCEVKGPGLVVA